jgi:ABC-type phosphate transport system substrate-binding protein
MPYVRGRRERARLLRLVAAVAILAVPAAAGLQSAGAAVAQPQVRLAASSTGDTTCSTASNRMTTCTGTYSGDNAWIGNPYTGKGKLDPNKPFVKVSPTTDLVSQVVSVQWGNFPPTLFEGAPAVPPDAADTNAYLLAIYECSGTDPPGPVGDGDLLDTGSGCYDISDTTQVQATAGAANGLIAFTSANGEGQANMYVEAGPENSFLHCGVDSPCSLVIVPNFGGVQPAGGHADCTDHKVDAGYALYGSIGATCSWADRIVVPLSFAPEPNQCPTSSAPVFQVAGSPMMEAAMEQWQAGWCQGPSALSFGYTSEDEYLARQFFLTGSGAVTASVDVALVTQPANATDSNGASPTARQYTYAPLANSAVAFAYYIDNPHTGELPTSQLVLNARLAAKLLTESYALDYSCAGQKPPLTASSTCDPAVAGNPDTIFDDPEFYDLNGGDTAANIANFPSDEAFSQLGDPPLQGTFLPLVNSQNSDMTYELTGWLASDKAASAFLGGQPVTGSLPGGVNTSMKVNSYYKNIAYPTSQFVPLDSGWSTEAWLVPGDADESMQAAWNPVADLDSVATDLATYTPYTYSPVPTCGTPTTGCQKTGWVNPRLPGEILGADEMTAVVSESQAAADDFPVFKLVNAAGDAVAPTDASILAAVSQMTTNADGITQSANFASTDTAAYPLAMVDYAMVPTCGLSAAKASAISAFLTDVATKGQQPGYLPGQLAPGYVPLNSHQLAQLKAAASAVKAQHCVGHGGPTGGSGSSGAGGSGGAGSTGKGSGGKDGTNLQTAAKLGKGNAHNAGYAVKDPFTAGLARLILPLLIIMGGLLGVGGPVTYVVGRTGGWAVLYQRTGTLPHRVARLVRERRLRGS